MGFYKFHIVQYVEHKYFKYLYFDKLGKLGKVGRAARSILENLKWITSVSKWLKLHFFLSAVWRME